MAGRPRSVALPPEDALKTIILEVVIDHSSPDRSWMTLGEICEDPRVTSMFSGSINGVVRQLIDSQVLRKNSGGEVAGRSSRNLSLGESPRRPNGQFGVESNHRSNK
jgi:hypothetical protein